MSDVSLAAGGIISATAPTAAVSFFFFIAANGCPALMHDQLFSELMSQYAIFCLWTLTLEVVKSARWNALEGLRDWSAGPFCDFNFFLFFIALFFCSEKNTCSVVTKYFFLMQLYNVALTLMFPFISNNWLQPCAPW